MLDVDDELVSAYLDGELSGAEEKAVNSLVEVDELWNSRYNEFKADSTALRKLPANELGDAQRALVFDLAESNMEAGSERRRVPRFKRRWMLLVALVVPTVFTLLFFQNPNQTCRVYLKAESLELQAGRSIAEETFQRTRVWKSPQLWGQYFPGDPATISYQMDTKAVSPLSVKALVEYDFNGDGQFDRREVYESTELDNRRGWERFTPALVESEGDFQHFERGEISLTLTVEGKEMEAQMSGTPGELILPYRGLRGSLGSYKDEEN